MCTSDRGVSSAKLRADVEGRCAAVADDDVVCVGVVFAPIALAAGGTCDPILCILAFGTRQEQCTRFWICMYSPHNQADTARHTCIIHRIT